MERTRIGFSIEFPTELTTLEMSTVKKAAVNGAFDAIKKIYEVDLNRELQKMSKVVCERFGFSAPSAELIVDCVLSLSEYYQTIKSKLSLIEEREKEKNV